MGRNKNSQATVKQLSSIPWQFGNVKQGVMNMKILKLLDDRLKHLRDLLSEKEQKYSNFPDPYVEGCIDTLDMVIQCFEGIATEG